MPIIFIPENNEYTPLELEPYRSFNKKFEDREDDIDGALIKLSIPNQRSIYIPGFKHLELSYRLTPKSVQLIFDTITEEEKAQSICNQLISHDIAIFSRGW